MRKIIKNILPLVLILFVVACGTRKAEEQPKKTTENMSAKSAALIQEGVEYLNQNDIVSAIKSFDNAIWKFCSGNSPKQCKRLLRALEYSNETVNAVQEHLPITQ